MFPLFILTLIAYLLDFKQIADLVAIAVKALLLASIAWGLIKLLDYLVIWLIKKKELSHSHDQLQSTITRLYLFKKILTGIVIILAISIFLLNFDKVREIGKGILLSAGLMGAAVVFAAQKILSNLFAGLQLIFNKPIKIKDIIKIDNNIGIVEEITMTCLSLRTADLRLIIYPIAYFIDKPFENWSYPTSDLIGLIDLYADFNLNLDAVRLELKQILENSPLWDKKINAIHVSEMTERFIQFQAVISAKNWSDLSSLRYHVREKLIVFLQRQPNSFPKVRTQLLSSNINKFDFIP